MRNAQGGSLHESHLREEGPVPGSADRQQGDRRTERLPILNNVLISTEDGHLRLTAFDLELGIECSVPATIEDAGALTVPARVLGEFLATLPESDVILSVNEQNAVNVKCEKSDYTILGLPPEEFPRSPRCRTSTASRFRRRSSRT